jgi:hypothetical protein
MYFGEAGKEGTVNDYLLEEMVRIRMDELRAEATSAHLAREARGSRGRRHGLGVLAGSWSARDDARGFPRGTVEEACCA